MRMRRWSSGKGFGFCLCSTSLKGVPFSKRVSSLRATWPSFIWRCVAVPAVNLLGRSLEGTINT